MTKAAPNTKQTTPKSTQSSQSTKTRTPKLGIPAFLAATPSAPTKSKAPSPRKKASPVTVTATSKQDRLIAMMKQAKGSSMAELMAATGWQAHSIRGVISGILKKRLCLNVVLESSADGMRRYRILKTAQA